MNVDGVLQSAAFNISGIETPAALAFDVAAPLVKCAENIEMSIPDCSIILLSQCPTVADFTG